MKYWKPVVLFSLGGIGYVGLELLWRGRSHISMFLAGGACFLLLGKLNRLRPRPSLLLRGIAGAATITTVELLTGLLANRDAVEEEWGKFGLLEHTDIVLAQDIGSKAACIKEMLKFGYDLNKVVMVGDAPGDCDAAEKNGVHYYPILVNHEKASWDEAIAVAYAKLQSGEYAEYGAQKKEEFLRNLGG